MAACDAAKEKPPTAAPEDGPSTANEELQSATFDFSDWYVKEGESITVAWKPSGGTVPRNESFDMDVRLLRNNQPCSGARIVVSGWMPDHGHGMVRIPQITEEGDGCYRVTDMLLHMRGHWDLVFEVHAGTANDTVRFMLDL